MKSKAGQPLLKYFLSSRLTLWLLAAVVFGAAIVTVNSYLLHQVQSPQSNGHLSSEASPPVDASAGAKNPVLWIYHKTKRPLGHVITVFDRVGYTLGGPADDWSVLWSHEYPFNSLPPDAMKQLKPHQKINHFPGSGCFTYKPRLATLDFPFIPKAFQLPQQAEKFKKEVVAQPKMVWVQKSNKHRGIKVRSIESINLNAGGSFVQQFIHNPLLVDGRKFDIGIYTALASVNPLRVYTYEEEVLLRFCSKNYHPFSADDPKKYVVDDEYTPTWEIPSMASLTVDQGLSHKHAFNMLLKNRGHDPTTIWQQAKSVIRQVLLHCEPVMTNYTKRYATTSRHFFEIIRFDFVVDEDLKVWLMEVNLSPNLSSAHTPGNRFMYEQVLFNLLSLVGLARATDGSTRYNGQYESIMLVNDRDIQIPLEDCIDGHCHDCSSRPTCKLCKSCRSDEDSFLLKTAFLEHVNRRNFRRAYPQPISDHDTQLQATNILESHSSVNALSPANLLMNMWFEGKCRQDPAWCT